MTDSGTTATDGRSARRQRNIDRVLEVVTEMFAEEATLPTMEQVATRSGLSLRSLYRYFADPSELFEAAVQRNAVEGRVVARIEPLGEGPFEPRLEVLIDSRIRVHRRFGATQRATIANAPNQPRARRELARTRDALRRQMVDQFEPEFARLDPAQRPAAEHAADVLTQLESIDFLRRHLELSEADAGEVLRTGLRALLT
ncbi:MAG: TetR/AcrR family transcriptional regulator [Actinomycetota bacterium]